jgi:hypothetical protein
MKVWMNAWGRMLEGVNASINSSQVCHQWALGGPFIKKIKHQITISIMPLSNHYITTQHSHKVITDFHDLQIFTCRANHRLTHVSYWISSIRGPSALRNLRWGSGGGETFVHPGPVKLPSMIQDGPGLHLWVRLHCPAKMGTEGAWVRLLQRN